MLKKTQIENLLREGKSKSEIVDLVGCTAIYVNQVRRDLGISKFSSSSKRPLIEKLLHEGRSISEIANIVNISKGHISKIGRDMGIKFISKGSQIEKLIRDGKTVKEIVKQTGVKSCYVHEIGCDAKISITSDCPIRLKIEKLLRDGKSINEIIDETKSTKSYIFKTRRRAGIVNGNERIVHHHTKYKEIHGVDEVIIITESEHKIIHNRLRKEGECNIPVDELKLISTMASERTDKRKKYKTNYLNNVVQNIYFNEPLSKNTHLFEWIVYNHKTGEVYFRSYFRSTIGYKLPVINI